MTPGGGTKPGGGGGKPWTPGGGAREVEGCTGPMLDVVDMLAEGWTGPIDGCTGPIDGWMGPMTGPSGAGAAVATADETNAGGRAAAAGAGGASPLDRATRRAYASSPVSSRRGGAGFDMATRRA